MNQVNINQRRNILKSEYIPKFTGISIILNNITKKSRSFIHLKQDIKINDIYNLLCKKELLIQALGNIERNKGRLTKGVTNQTIDGNNLKRIEDICEQLKNGTFKFKPVRRIEVPKPKILKFSEKKKMRPLGIPTFEDKVVQEAIRIILEAIYEPVFEKYNCNYGFREKKNTHQAILKIKYQGTGSNIAIEGDIQGAYDNTDHDILINILSKKIADKKFLKLLYQGFKAGILIKGIFTDSMTGVPQGGIASPILFNIYMHEFDEYIHTNLQEHINNYNELTQRSYKPRSKIYNKISTKFTRAKFKYERQKQYYGNKKFVELNKEQQENLLKLRKEMRTIDLLKVKLPSINKSRKAVKILYVRYADDFIILTNGNKNFANEIKEKIEKFLLENLKLKLSPEKTLITNLELKGAKFLGFSIKTYLKRRLGIGSAGTFQKRAGWNIIIDIDQQRLLDRLQIHNYINKAAKPVAKRSWSVLQPQEIITRFNYLLRGIANYYFPVLDRLSHLNRIFYIYKFSCLSTFAKKYKSKITKITKRFGNPLSVTITEITKRKEKESERQKTYTLLTYETLKNELEYKKFDFKTYRESSIKNVETDVFKPMKTINWRTYKNLENVCIICGTNINVEQHHVRHVRKGKVTGFAQVMNQLNRRMVPLCRPHHNEVEHGKYDGIKLQDLFDIQRFLS